MNTLFQAYLLDPKENISQIQKAEINADYALYSFFSKILFIYLFVCLFVCFFMYKLAWASLCAGPSVIILSMVGYDIRDHYVSMSLPFSVWSLYYLRGRSCSLDP